MNFSKNFLRSLFALCCFAVMPATVTATEFNLDQQIASLRDSIESGFKQTTGLGFAKFDCDFPSNWPTSQEFFCEATDTEGDQFTYHMWAELDSEDLSYSMSQSVQQLNPSGLAALSQPSDLFLEAFISEDWDTVHSSLSPKLMEQLALEDLKKLLQPTRSELGSIGAAKAKRYSTPGSGIHQLEYYLETSQGKAVARFRFRIGGDSNARIMAFLVTSIPASPLHVKLLSEIGKTVLGRFFDKPIVRLEGSLQGLKYIGDNIDIRAVLSDNTSVAIHVLQNGTALDLDPSDYFFQILDARTLLRLHLNSKSVVASNINCPYEVTPDNQEMECTVTLSEGPDTRFKLLRRGGKHRLIEL